MTPVGAVIEAINLFFDYMYSGNLAVGEVGKPPGTWFSATGWYYSGYGERHYMSININGNNGGEVAYAGDHIHIFTNPSVADLGSFEVTYWNGWAQLRSGNNFDFTAVLPDGTNQNIDVLTFGMNVDTQQDSWWINDNITALPGAGGGGFIGMKNDDSSFPIISNARSMSDLGRSTIYVPIDGATQYTYDDAMNIILPALQVQFPDLTVNDFKTEYDIVYGESETETETETGGCCGCDCTTIYVNADGSLTLNNDITGNMPINIDNNADLSLSVNAAAGAFGAGAIVVDPDANINLDAGAFGAGAFGAGAIVNPNVSVSGNVDVGDISGEVNVNASEITISGGDVNIDQSGATNNNTYNNTYNNYYYGSTEPVEPEQPFTIDYDEIISEGEMESILTQETYDIPEYETEFFKQREAERRGAKQKETDFFDDVEEIPTELTGAPDFVVDSVKTGWNMLQDWGVSSFFVGCATVCAIWKVIHGN